MTDNLTGPEEYKEAQTFVQYASDGHVGGHRLVWDDHPGLALQRAQVHATNALTAIMVTIAENLGDYPPYELDAWREVIPRPPLKECKGKEVRRPACEERHTADCQFTDPMYIAGQRVRRRRGVPPVHGTISEGCRSSDGTWRVLVQWDGAEESWIDQGGVEIVRHERLDVGTRVLVVDSVTYYDHKTEVSGHPRPGKIVGYATNGCYKIAREWSTGSYSEDHFDYVFMDERVQVHPDGPECPPPPQPVKREPTGPRVYVENQRGKQGYVLEVLHIEKDDSLWYRVQFLVPGVVPVLKRADSLAVIAPSQVERCPNGQTRDECSSGENQCEPCLQAEDEEADAIEESMGL